MYSPNQSEPRETDSDMTDESEDEPFQKKKRMFEDIQKKKETLGTLCRVTGESKFSLIVEKRVKAVPAINGKTRPPKRKGAQKEGTKAIESTIEDERQIESNNSSFNSNQSDLDAQSLV